jgi:3-hydroxyisobutyrate dehydrogenase
MYGSKGNTLLDRNFAANFVVDNMLKDLNLATQHALQSKTPLPFTALSREMFLTASSLGYGGEDYSAAVKVLETLAGTEITRQ